MKDHDSSNYPPGKTIFVEAKNSPVVACYSESKTTFVRWVTSVSTPYSGHKTANVSVRIAPVGVSGRSADIKPVETKSAFYPSPKTSPVSFKVATPAPSVLAKAVQGKEKSSNYPSNKTAEIIFKTTPVPMVGTPQVNTPLPERAISPVKGIGKEAKRKLERQPALLILTIISLVFILGSAFLGWMNWQQKNQMEVLLEDHQKLKDITGLKVEDVIGGGLKSNKGFAPATNEIADAKFVRICFSIAANDFAVMGKRTVFVRLVNPENKTVFLSEKPVANVSGNLVECTFMEEILFEGDEIFVCRDLDKSEDMNTGKYKIEVFLEGSLKGESSFELK